MSELGVGDARRGERRQRRAFFVWRERRCGFDRRRQSVNPAVGAVEDSLYYLRDHSGVLLAVLVAANLLNLADYVLTLNVLAQGGGEANPLLRGLFATAPWAAGLFKLTAVGAISLLIWQLRRYRLLLLASLALLGVFVALLLYHFYGLAVVMR
jgi:hypothetical protein